MKTTASSGGRRTRVSENGVLRRIFTLEGGMVGE